jgi:hypothetical protein
MHVLELDPKIKSTRLADHLCSPVERFTPLKTVLASEVGFQTVFISNKLMKIIGHCLFYFFKTPFLVCRN